MKTSRNLNSKYVMRNSPSPNANQSVKVCMGYANCVPKKQNGDWVSSCPLARGNQWAQCQNPGDLDEKRTAGKGGDPATGPTTCYFKNGTVTIKALNEPGAGDPCIAPVQLGPKDGSPMNDFSCYNALKDAGCIISSSASPSPPGPPGPPGPSPKPTPKPTPSPSPSPPGPSPSPTGKLGGKCKEGKKCDDNLICKSNKCIRPSNPSPKPTPGPSTDQGLSTPAVVGISVGGALLLIGIILGIAHLANKKKKGRK